MSATIITTLGRSMSSPLLLSLPTKLINNNDGDSRTGSAARQERLRRNFKNSEDSLRKTGNAAAENLDTDVPTVYSAANLLHRNSRQGRNSRQMKSEGT